MKRHERSWRRNIPRCFAMERLVRDLSLMCFAVFLKEITLQNKTSELHSVLPVIANLQELSTKRSTV